MEQNILLIMARRSQGRALRGHQLSRWCTGDSRFIFSGQPSPDFPMANLRVSNRNSWDRVRSQQSNLCPFRWAIGRPQEIPRSWETYNLKSKVANPSSPAATPHNSSSPSAQDWTHARCPPVSLCSAPHWMLASTQAAHTMPHTSRQPFIHSSWQSRVSGAKRDTLLRAQRSSILPPPPDGPAGTGTLHSWVSQWRMDLGVLSAYKEE